MASVNKVILIGNLGKEPEGRVMPSGTQVTKFSLATNEKWKDKKTGEMQTKTEWHNIVMYNKLAEIGATLLKKGMSVYIEGSISTDKWKDKEGQDKTTTSIVASVMQILSGMEAIKRQLIDSGAIKLRPSSGLRLQNIKEKESEAPASIMTSGLMRLPFQNITTSMEDDDLPF
jgi:single-strand DNA-binding protein